MNDIEAQINTAAINLDLSPNQFRVCDRTSANKILREAREVFVIGNPRSWWLSLKRPFETFDYYEGRAHEDISRHVPEDEESCWLIPETEEDSLPVFDIKISCISRILGECPFFEYYLVSKKVNWLIIETDHNQLIISRRTAMEG